MGNIICSILSNSTIFTGIYNILLCLYTDLYKYITGRYGIHLVAVVTTSPINFKWYLWVEEG